MSSYSWSISGNGTIDGATNGQSVKVDATGAGSYTLTLTITDANGCSSTCAKTVTVNALPACSITGANEVCTGATGNSFSGPAGASSYAWQISGNGTIVGSTTGQSVNVTAGAAGSFTLTLRVTDANGCSSACAKTVTVNPQATVNAGADQSLPACDTTQAQLSGSIGGAASSATWSTSGTGTFSPNATTLNAVYIPSQADLTAGSVTLTLTTNDPAGPCPAASDTVVITFTACANCFKGVGNPFPEKSEASDDKAGSVLVYNFYTSNPISSNTTDTRFNLTNVSQTDSVAVHLFFVDGATCTVADSFVCLTKNQTTTFLASDIDPGTTGYMIAVATDCVTGCPIAFNCLIGDAFIKLDGKHAANLGAEALSALSSKPAVCDANSVMATLNFDGVSYNRTPRVLAASNVPSRGDGNDTLMVLNRFGGDLTGAANTIGSVFGIFYDDTENALSFGFNAGCQLRSSITNNFPRLVPRFETFVPAGRSAWFKLWAANDAPGGIFGATINFNPNSKSSPGVFNQGHNMHVLKLTTTSKLIVPIFPPSCCR
jgi:hypothetical protein